jgi:phosphopantetheinyl transferase
MAKPVLTAQGWEHSMSHSGRLSVCVVADAPVGIDVELLDVPRRSRLAPGVPQRFFTTRERDMIAHDPDAVLRIFTLKEAWVKREGIGLGFGIGSFDQEIIEARHPDVTFTIMTLPGAVCTVCHRVGDAFVARPVQLTAVALAAAAALDQEERAQCLV